MSQLDIFSWQNEAYSSAWQALASLDFSSCEQTIREILSKDAEDSECAHIVEFCGRWKRQYELLKEAPSHQTTDAFVTCLLAETFSLDYGPQSLRKQLFKDAITFLREEKRFFSGGGQSIAKLYGQLGDHATAASEMARYIDGKTDQPSLYLDLGNYQWQAMLYAEARYSYLQVIILAGDRINGVEIENPLLAQIIKKHGATESAAWAWLYGEQLPLSRLSEIPFDSSAVQLCKLLLQAERIRKEKPSDVASSRKALHDCNTVFYSAYFEYLTKGTLKI